MKYAFYPGCSYHSAAGYKESVVAVNRLIGVELEEIADWNCCGATVYPGMDEFGTVLLGARVFALARKAGFAEVITGCNACYTTLRKALSKIAANTGMIDAVNRRLADEGLQFDPAITIRHLLDVYVNDVPAKLWAQQRKCDLRHIRVAAYYGCQLLRPYANAAYEDLLEKLIAQLGATSVTHSARTLCCGASLAVSYADECQPLIHRIIGGISAQEADFITTICPLCQLNLDRGQMGIRSPKRNLPVTYFSQMAGLALGIPFAELGLNKLIIPLTEKVLSCYAN